MDDQTVWKINTDGGSRGNPGPAAFAFIIQRPGLDTVEAKGYLGSTTNNIAEYTALVRALEHALKLGGKRLVVESDSELMVQQMNGAYKVKNPGILPLYNEAKALRSKFANVAIRHVRREYNSEADRLCNEALDNPRGAIWPPPGIAETAAATPLSPEPPAAREPTLTLFSPDQPAPPKKKTGSKAKSEAPVSGAAKFRARAAERLHQVAEQWSMGEADAPTPEDVVAELWDMLRQEDCVR